MSKFCKSENWILLSSAGQIVAELLDDFNVWFSDEGDNNSSGVLFVNELAVMLREFLLLGNLGNTGGFALDEDLVILLLDFAIRPSSEDGVYSFVLLLMVETIDGSPDYLSL